MKARHDLDQVRQDSEKHGIWKTAERRSSQILMSDREMVGMGAYPIDQTI